ncbi:MULTISPECIES: nucleotidyltransferase substrate binding protein [Clostridium]|uniref:Nucleotidyltransferase substrate binding protein like protein n=2 Tax=Clostridium TaxID=1485 RepID=D8GQD7_CLOLD|nr:MULTISPECIES: nucleotidyltransferase substrate binding protein [Clostridium]ADK14060.1 putative nucleotidyltransferase substrate binding protein [Clostridium ljungdahlii DSM 13528]AGY77286.1 nucleotidyltransferase substrate binding protein [Clostridium autoethanogenum DSM 10061]ALU37428.1 Nucleotidyltransferase substrate binding protein [Clostridium autoethanogenum DSM 10061]OAA86262.1 Nucleotidyltransferase substrate binding protein like protein [Clostridium ljungdahlii DSM 13528]OVY49075.
MKRLDERIYDFINALSRLREALEKDITDDIIVDGIIQRFEFTFEQSWKVMKLYLEDQGILDEALAPRSTIRVAFKHKIISNGDLWIEMMLDRNRTSHMYDETTAKNIVERIKKVYINEFNDLEKFLKE